MSLIFGMFFFLKTEIWGKYIHKATFFFFLTIKSKPKIFGSSYEKKRITIKKKTLKKNFNLRVNATTKINLFVFVSGCLY